MKNYFLLALLLVVSGLSAQIVNIPDANFKAKLIALGIDMNGDGEIQNAEAEAVTKLDVSNDSISDMTGIEAFVNLDTLDCSKNQLTSLNVSALINLSNLACNNNQIQNLDVNTLINLAILFCSINQITNLNVGNLSNLQELYCSSNQIQNLDVSNINNLKILRCEGNQLTNLNVNGLTSLSVLFCHANQLTYLDLSTCTDLQNLFCYSNNLNILNLNNGRNENIVSFVNNPNLEYICADASQLSSIQQQIVQYGMTNVSINSFCSFPPGGNYNTIVGTCIYDANMNGCTAADAAYPFLKINITDGIDTGYFYTKSIGNFAVYTDSGTLTFTPQPQNLTYFSASPISTNIYFPNHSNNIENQDFCIISNGIFPDVEIVLSPITPARPGFDATYQLFFHNKGTTTVSGDIIVDFMGNKMTFVSASQATSAQTANQLTWNYSNLQPFESRSISFVMNILPPPTNNVGDILYFSANIPLVNDTDSADNSLTFAQNVVGSFDPNDKTCLEGNHLLNTQIGEYLHYLIRFQNTGNYPADHVVVVDSIYVNQFDIASLQILETSHNAHITVNQGVLQFYFENIQLADSFSNEPASHGYVLFKIKTKANLPQNSSVSNKAEIYFDYNLPVVTNTEITTFGNTIGVFDAIQKPHFQLYPNPAQNSLTIETEKAMDFVILNVMGEVLINKHIEGKQMLDISMLPKGIYFIQEKNTNLGQVFMRE